MPEEPTQPTQPAESDPVGISVPTHEDVLRDIEKVAKPPQSNRNIHLPAEEAMAAIMDTGPHPEEEWEDEPKESRPDLG